MENKNMSIWNKVCETDPAYTKPVKLGPYKFTAIDAQYQIRIATELWGPYGHRWGLDNMKWAFIGDPAQPEALMLTADFYYPASSTRETENPVYMRTGSGPELIKEAVNGEGRFGIASDIPYVPKKDCFKKLQTDVTTKALSKLGFNADVFEGKFDDNKYVEEMRLKKEGTVVAGNFAGPSEPPRVEPPRKDPFIRAIGEMRLHKNWDDKKFWDILGGMGYEKIEEITNEAQRRQLASTLRKAMEIPK